MWIIQSWDEVMGMVAVKIYMHTWNEDGENSSVGGVVGFAKTWEEASKLEIQAYELYRLGRCTINKNKREVIVSPMI